MTHTTQLTVGARALASSILSIPEQFKTPSEIVRAACLQDLLAVTITAQSTKEELEVVAPVELTETQRDMLKKSVESNAAKIPVSNHAVCLLTALGFTE